MAHIILTGATGLAGSAVLAHCLESASVSRVSILSRRPVKMAEGNNKAKVIVHSDYEQYPEQLLEELKDASACIWAQGKSSVGMKESDYVQLTHDFPIAAATAFSSLSNPFKFVYISGEGADTSESSRAMFGRIKGRAEKSLLALQDSNPSLRVYCARPAYIDPGKNFLADRTQTLMEKTMAFVAPALRKLASGFVSPTDKLAEALVGLAVSDGGPIPENKGVESSGRILRNVALRRLAGL